MTELAEEHQTFQPFGPGDLMWDWAGDVRSLITMPGMLVLQSFHPTVAAGVGEHSLFESDPWGRRSKAIESVMKRVYDRDQTAQEGLKLRALHKPFIGVDDQGRRYSALNPDAYGFVHHTAFPWLLITAEHFGTPFTEEEKRRAYSEHLRSGRMLRLREQDLPPTIEDFWVYWQDRLDNHLEDHATTHKLFASLAKPLPPPQLPRSLHKPWRGPGLLVGKVASLVIRAYLPPQAREVGKIPWTSRDQRAYERFCSVVRTTIPRLPESRRYTAFAYRARTAARNNVG